MSQFHRPTGGEGLMKVAEYIKEKASEYGLDDVKDAIVFHAGTKEKDGKIITNGGRVMAVTSFGDNIETAIQKSYTSIDKIHFEKMNYRKDIGFDLI